MGSRTLHDENDDRSRGGIGDGIGTGPDTGSARWLRWRPSRRVVTATLGAVWFADGILQLQPSMFDKSFALSTLAGAAQGQPGWVASSVTDVARFLAPHMVLWNVLFALTQLAIGAAFLFDRALKPTIVASIAWSVGVWWFGEAFGGLFSGTASIITGAPGAVALYGLVAVMVWPRDEAGEETGASPRSVPGRLFATWGGRVAWAVLWTGSAVLQLLPVNRSDGAVASAIAGSASGEPHVLAALSTGAAHLVGTHGATVAVVLAVLEIAVGIGALWRRPGIALVAGVVLSLAFWVVGQDLGGILTGSGTDPNAGPLFVLLAVALWSGMARSMPAGRGGSGRGGVRRGALDAGRSPVPAGA